MSLLSRLLKGIILISIFIHPDIQTQWFPVNSTGTNYNIKSIQFINFNTGFAVSDLSWNNFPNDVIKTTDGGLNWNVIYSENMALYNCIYFLNENTGFLTGGLYADNNCKILKTSDSGNNWFSVAPSNTIGYIYNCSFINNNTGYACGSHYIGGIILKSTNTGLNWQISYFYYPMRAFTTLYFVNSETGFSAGDSGIVVKTTNAGLNWVQLTSGTTNNLTSLFFVNVNTGYAVGRYGTVLKTANSGLTWININNLFIHLSDVLFTNALTGYTTGISGSIFKTTDGGESFSPSYHLPVKT
ncbi:MAG TPA: hypothetical protein VJ455_05745 [Ignavibacteria bacterium]|nr:hypothetical protein [Ignavibacteria bacterium]